MFFRDNYKHIYLEMGVERKSATAQDPGDRNVKQTHKRKKAPTDRIIVHTPTNGAAVLHLKREAELHVRTALMYTKSASNINRNRHRGRYLDRPQGCGVGGAIIGTHLSNYGIPGVMLVLLDPTVQRVILHHV